MAKKNYQKKVHNNNVPNVQKTKVYKFKDEKELAFKKRNYFDSETQEKVLIEAGLEISKETYDLLGARSKAIFCEVVEK